MAITLFFTQYKPPTYTLLSPQIINGVGSGKFISERRWERPILEVAFEFDGVESSSIKDTAAMLQYSQGDMEYWFDGCDFVDPNIVRPVAVADGIKTQFQLPHRNVFAPTLIVMFDGGIVSTWTLDEAEGVITFSSPPADGIVITAKYVSKFRVKVFYDAEELLTISDMFKAYGLGSVKFREVP